MSLRTIFKTAAYCSPTLAGMGATFATMGASLQGAGFIGGTILASWLMFHYSLRAQEKPLTLREAPQRLQDRFEKLKHEDVRDVRIHLLTTDRRYENAGYLNHVYALPHLREIWMGDHLYKSSSPKELDFYLSHELMHLRDPDVTAKRMGFLAMALMKRAMFLSPLAALVPGNEYYLTGIGMSVLAAVGQRMLWLHLARATEYACDHGAVSQTGDAYAALLALDRMTDQEGPSMAPIQELFFADHPSLHHRKMAIAKEFMPAIEVFLKEEMDRYQCAEELAPDRARMDPFNYMP